VRTSPQAKSFDVRASTAQPWYQTISIFTFCFWQKKKKSEYFSTSTTFMTQKRQADLPYQKRERKQI
tara:strand:- start:913 stop:1113 length:201 start_codon:yes stop_codon:yes gene_type:complete